MPESTVAAALLMVDWWMRTAMSGFFSVKAGGPPGAAN